MTFVSVALIAAAPAFAHADLETTMNVPASTDVYADDTYSVTVSNTGNRTAKNVSVTIDLPETANSPTAYVMGEVVGLDSACSQSGSQITCSVGRLRKNKSDTVWFDMWLPWSADAIEFESDASTSSRENSTANNDDSDTAVQTYEAITISGPVDVENLHCTGTNLTAFYECTLSPSSIMGHSATYNADGSISFDEDEVGPGYGGSWGQVGSDDLWFEYTFGGNVVAEFEGNGIDPDCFEGLTTFPTSSWVAPYEICLQ